MICIYCAQELGLNQQYFHKCGSMKRAGAETPLAPVEKKEMKYLGNFSAVDPAYSRHMECYDCNVSWTGCWDNFQCPKCGKGELPTSK